MREVSALAKSARALGANNLEEHARSVAVVRDIAQPNVSDAASSASVAPGDADETSRECPDVRAEVLKVLGFDTFSGNL